MIATKALPQDQFVQVGGFRARYWKVGQGAPLLLLHGIAHSVRAWEQNLEGLSARHTVYALDIIGHGLTDKPTSSYHISDLAKFIRDFMAAVDLPKVHLIGHSMGGAIAMHFAVMYPSQVDKLVLVAPAGIGSVVGLSFRLASLPLLGEYLTRPDWKRLQTVSRSLVFDQAIIRDEFVDWQYEYNALPGAQAAHLAIIRTHLNIFGFKKWVTDMVNSELDRFKTPTLAIWGENDNVIPLDSVRSRISAMKNITLHTLRYCGHVVQLEYPEEFNRLVLNFVNG
ncbi:MAG: hypothetical protein CUN53_06365 [Phototrophicales bacterium]|nr:MAG: hypothetical protein CUN53_06365 [Phototrophicales bacterium]